MKIQVLSDLHTEFAPFTPVPADADVVVVAGDAAPGLRSLAVVAECAGGKPAVCVAGNHEYYGEAIPHLTHKLRREASGTGVHFLEDEAVVLGGVRFLGCTLWTDFDLFGAERRMEAARAAQAVMNDFRIIRRSPEFRRFLAGDARSLHQRSVRWLRERLDEPFDGPTVVVTHHAPGMRSVSPRFRDDLVTAAYASDLEGMMDGGRVALWIHGHTHFSVDHEVNGTRVLANQRGYPDDAVEGFRPDLVVEV